MKSKFFPFLLVGCVILCLGSSNLVVAQNQTQDQDNQGQNRYQPRDPYKPYVKPPEPRIIDSKSMVQLDGGEVGAPIMRAGGFNGNRNRAGAGGGNLHTGPAGPSRFSGGSRNGQFANRGSGSRGNSGFQVSYNNGARTISVDESTRKIKIVDDPNTGIYMEVTRSYGPRQMARLKQKLPELTEYIELFPSEVGNDEVKLSIELTSKYSARTPQDLEDQDRGVYNIYKRYTKQVGQEQNFNNQNANMTGQGQGQSYPGYGLPRKKRNLPTASVGGSTRGRK